jgi:hypothetical protein
LIFSRSISAAFEAHDALCKSLRLKGEPVVEAVAVEGKGVFETLREVAKLVLAELKKGS